MKEKTLKVFVHYLTPLLTPVVLLLSIGVATIAFAFPSFGEVVCEDADGDGWDDCFDNCLVVANASQLDVDNDGCGNACDGDFSQDGSVNASDFLTFRGGFLTNASGVTDHNGNGVTDGVDFLTFRGQFQQGTPGPSLNAFRDLTACP